MKVIEKYIGLLNLIKVLLVSVSEKINFGFLKKIKFYYFSTRILDEIPHILK